MDYLFVKVESGVHSSHDGEIDFGLSMLKIIKEKYRRFEKYLFDRGDLDEYTKHDLDEYSYALKKIDSFLNMDDSLINENDARVFLSYIKNQHACFVKAAQEIDEQYRVDV